ncbi:hypothetical protein [Streptacidiphilus sp. EB129]|uniref:hypothetical protein n=1 Tax=Streptacidiphilus sp. EB129 TaxID=3156262 RepID=UPI003513031E
MSDLYALDTQAEVTADARRQLRVFLATPSLRLTGPVDGGLTLAVRDRATALREALLDCGVSVYSTHHGDTWSARGLHPGQRVPSPFRAIQSADVVFSYVGTPLSAGISLELGWATALRKPVVLMVDKAGQHLQLIDTLEAVAPVLPLKFLPSWSVQELRHAIVTGLHWVDDETLTVPA